MKKFKLLKICGLLTGALAITAIPIISTSCSTIEDSSVVQGREIELGVVNLKEKQKAQVDQTGREAASENAEKIDLYETITNNDILDALSWNAKESTEESVGKTLQETDEILPEKLDLSKVSKDLKLESNETLKKLIISMEQRNPSESNYNGLFKIKAETILGEDESTVKTHTFVSKESKSENFQLTVPNAYIIDTTKNTTINDSEIVESTLNNPKTNPFKFINIDFFDNKFFVLGGKDLVDKAPLNGENEQDKITEDIFTYGISENLKMNDTFSKFIKKIDMQQKAKKQRLFNGVEFSFESAKKHSSMEQGFRTIITLNVSLKQGFNFKSAFEHGKESYNVIGKTSQVSFGISYSQTNVGEKYKGAIRFDQEKTVAEINELYKTVDEIAKPSEQQ